MGCCIAPIFFITPMLYNIRAMDNYEFKKKQKYEQLNDVSYNQQTSYNDERFSIAAYSNIDAMKRDYGRMVRELSTMVGTSRMTWEHGIAKLEYNIKQWEGILKYQEGKKNGTIKSKSSKNR